MLNDTVLHVGVVVVVLLQMLHDTFSAFGVIINTPKIMRDPDTGARAPQGLSGPSQAGSQSVESLSCDAVSLAATQERGSSSKTNMTVMTVLSPSHPR